VATLKAETSLSKRTSRVKSVAVTKALGDGAAGADGACAQHEIALAALGEKPHCVLGCPRLNCTRGVELCFATPACVAVDITIRGGAPPAIARLRYAPAV